MRYDLPAVAAAIVKKGEIVASGAVGTRRAGTSSPVTVEDRFHIGSDTKAMTSLIAAMFVEGGRISWSSTVSDVFPELTAHMDQGVRAVTLGQLLSHTSGIPSDTEAHEKLIQQSFAQEKRNLDELRFWIIQQLVTQPLQSEPGKKYAERRGFEPSIRFRVSCRRVDGDSRLISTAIRFAAGRFRSRAPPRRIADLLLLRGGDLPYRFDRGDVFCC
jgi:hypothetical protein